MNERVLSQVEAAEIEFWEEFLVWHFATKCPVVKLIGPRDSNVSGKLGEVGPTC